MWTIFRFCQLNNITKRHTFATIFFWMKAIEKSKEHMHTCSSCHAKSKAGNHWVQDVNGRCQMTLIHRLIRIVFYSFSFLFYFCFTTKLWIFCRKRENVLNFKKKHFYIMSTNLLLIFAESGTCVDRIGNYLMFNLSKITINFRNGFFCVHSLNCVLRSTVSISYCRFTMRYLFSSQLIFVYVFFLASICVSNLPETLFVITQNIILWVLLACDKLVDRIFESKNYHAFKMGSPFKFFPQCF